MFENQSTKNSPYAPGPVFRLKQKSPRLNDRKRPHIIIWDLFRSIQPRGFDAAQIPGFSLVEYILLPLQKCGFERVKASELKDRKWVHISNSSYAPWCKQKCWLIRIQRT